MRIRSTTRMRRDAMWQSTPKPCPPAVSSLGTPLHPCETAGPKMEAVPYAPHCKPPPPALQFPPPPRGGGGGTRPWWLDLCGGTYWPLAFCYYKQTSALPRASTCLGGGEGGSRMQLLPMASSPDGLISARDAVITKTPGWEVLTTTRNVNVTQGHGC